MIRLYSQQSGDIQARYVPTKDPGRNQSTRFKSGVLGRYSQAFLGYREYFMGYGSISNNMEI